MATLPKIGQGIGRGIDLGAGMRAKTPLFHHGLRPKAGVARGTGLKPDNKGNKTPEIGKVEAASGRLVLQEPKSAPAIQRTAAAEHEEAKNALEKALEGVEGARLSSDRAEKDPERVAEKVDEGQSPRTVRDYSGFRVAVDTPEAWKRAAAAIRAHFAVPDEQDEFEKGSEENFHGHTLQIQLPGSKVTHEVQILPREVAEHADADHALYDKARDGDQEAAAKLKDVNRGRYIDFLDRNGTAEYKLGSTQTELPPESDAAKGLEAARAKIADGDLAGKGRDVGGNHVTVRYGLTRSTEDAARLREHLRKQPPFTVKLGATAAFPPSKSSEGAAVIHAPVTSPELEQMHAGLGGQAAWAPSNFTEYKPHATVAYVKPEAATQYTGMQETDGKAHRVTQVHITHRDGSVEPVALEGAGDGERVLDGGGPAGGGEAAKRKGVSGPLSRNVGAGAGRAAAEPRGGPGTASGPASAAAGTPPKKGDAVVLEDGRRATVAYAPWAPMPAKAYRFRPDAGGPQVEMLAAKVAAGGAVKANAEPDGGWDGYDLDGTLAEYHGWQGAAHVGAPIPRMVDQVKAELAAGKDIRILTARISKDPKGEARKAIVTWCEKNLGRRVPLTDVKDAKMRKLYDDRAATVERNTGRILAEPSPDPDAKNQKPRDRFAAMSRERRQR